MKTFDLILKTFGAELWPSDAVKIPRIQAHRGLCVNGAIENTLMAFREAKKHGAFMTECDVQLTKDQVPVCFHDQDLKRLANTNYKVGDLKFEEFKKYFPQLCSLEELLKDHKSPAFLNIELKTEGSLNEALERNVAEVIDNLHAVNRVMFSSFNPVSLWKISHYLPKVPRALIYSEDIRRGNLLSDFALKAGLSIPLLKLHSIHIDKNDLTLPRIKTLKSLKVPFSVWTVQSKVEGEHLLSQGCLSVISDNWVS